MIYLVEDDQSIRELVLYMMKTSGWEACGFAYGADFWQALKERLPDLILLDIMLPDEDGIEILKKIRKSSETKQIPVILLTARGSEYDKVMGLDSGADDYVTKPFGMMELASRIRALLRRTERSEGEVNYQVGELRVDIKRHIVMSGTEPIVLTYKEFELLIYLIRNQGIVLNREQILSTVWGYDFDGENRTVDVHIRTLRQKLGPAGDLIETVRGVGYRIRSEQG